MEVSRSHYNRQSASTMVRWLLLASFLALATPAVSSVAPDHYTRPRVVDFHPPPEDSYVVYAFSTIAPDHLFLVSAVLGSFEDELHLITEDLHLDLTETVERFRRDLAVARHQEVWRKLEAKIEKKAAKARRAQSIHEPVTATSQSNRVSPERRSFSPRSELHHYANERVRRLVSNVRSGGDTTLATRYSDQATETYADQSDFYNSGSQVPIYSETAPIKSRISKQTTRAPSREHRAAAKATVDFLEKLYAESPPVEVTPDAAVAIVDETSRVLSAVLTTTKERVTQILGLLREAVSVIVHYWQVLSNPEGVEEDEEPELTEAEMQELRDTAVAETLQYLVSELIRTSTVAKHVYAEEKLEEDHALDALAHVEQGRDEYNREAARAIFIRYLHSLSPPVQVLSEETSDSEEESFVHAEEMTVQHDETFVTAEATSGEASESEPDPEIFVHTEEFTVEQETFMYSESAADGDEGAYGLSSAPREPMRRSYLPFADENDRLVPVAVTGRGNARPVTSIASDDGRSAYRARGGGAVRTRRDPFVFALNKSVKDTEPTTEEAQLPSTKDFVGRAHDLLDSVKHRVIQVDSAVATEAKKPVLSKRKSRRRRRRM